MRFHLEQYEKKKAEGLEALRRGEPEVGRQCFLDAARSLLLAASESEPPMRAARRDAALRLRDVALGLPAEHGKAARSNGRKPAATDENSDLTPETKWLLAEKPNRRFDQIAGLEEVKEGIRLRVIYPFRFPEAAARLRKKPGGGMLLYGPPGTGKTMIAEAIASELDAQFFNVKSSNILSQWVGLAEQNIAKLFECARACAKSVIFIDEVEALVPRRGGNSTVMNRVVPEFLAQADGLGRSGNCMLLVGATNRPWDLDDAALRPGRFSEHFFVGLPEAPAREQILHLNLDGLPLDPAVDLHAVALKVEGFSGADVAKLCGKATDYPFQRHAKAGDELVITQSDIDRALAETRPSVDRSTLAQHRRFADGR